MKITKFEELTIWQLSLKVTKRIYDISAKPQFNNDFGLKNQIRKSVISISSNIVEGFEKNNNNEFVRFLKIAKGSAGETRNQLYIALTVGYVNKQEFEIVNKHLEDLANQIGGLTSYLEKLKKSRSSHRLAK